jgi:hypothetical protein
MNTNRDLSIHEAADLLSLQPETVRKAAREGRCPGAYKALGVWRIRRDVLEQIRDGAIKRIVAS